MDLDTESTQVVIEKCRRYHQYYYQQGAACHRQVSSGDVDRTEREEKAKYRFRDQADLW